MLRSMKSILTLFLLGLSLIAGISEEAKEGKTFRVMTYNIHHGVGPDGKLDLERIAALIKSQKADIVALQEVDRGTLRTARRDLPAELAKLTGMNVCFEKNIDYQGGEYGNAVLTRFPILEKKNTLYKMSPHREQRGLLYVVLELHGRKLLFLNTHLDYLKDDRPMNLKQMKETLDAHPNLPVIFCGDFNDTPGSRTHKRLSEFLTDTWQKVGNGNGHTFSSVNPAKRIDYIWISKEFLAIKAWVPQSHASDHLAVVAEFALE